MLQEVQLCRLGQPGQYVLPESLAVSVDARHVAYVAQQERGPAVITDGTAG
jgi:hypothetical protein